ncbi:MAG TPA: hypothetical protein VK325_10450 [Pseudoxanthomonas sp.]|nr:hypothetical protein [Pseudoxanthomonas sp.]
MTKRRTVSRRGNKAVCIGVIGNSFECRMDPSKGLVIRQVAESATKQDWRGIDELIQFFRCLAPGMDNFHVELKR